MAESLPGTHRVTLGADKGYDTRDFITELRRMEITPHVAQNDTKRRSAVDERTTRHGGYQVSQKRRKRIEEVFGWMKSIGLLRKLRHRGMRARGLDVYLYGSGLQPAAYPQPDAWGSTPALCLNAPRNLFTIHSQPKTSPSQARRLRRKAPLRLSTVVFQQPVKSGTQKHHLQAQRPATFLQSLPPVLQ